MHHNPELQKKVAPKVNVEHPYPKDAKVGPSIPPGAAASSDEEFAPIGNVELSHPEDTKVGVSIPAMCSSVQC